MKQLLLLFIILLYSTSIGFSQQMMVKPSEVDQQLSFDFWVGSNETWNELTFFPFTTLDNYISYVGVTLGVGSDSDLWSDWNLYKIEGRYIFRDIMIRHRDVGSTGLVWGAEYNLDWYIQNFYGYIPYSVRLGDFDLHTNIGFKSVYYMMPPNDSWVNYITTGIRTDYSPTDRITILGEVFSYDIDEFIFQKGVRYHIVPRRIWIDLTAGNDFTFRNKKRQMWYLYSFENVAIYDTRMSRNMDTDPQYPFFNLGVSFNF